MAASLPFSDERTGFAGPVTVAREPYGVAVTILTYNGPLAYIGMKVLPALLSGNTVILKMPVETRLVTQYIGAAAEEAGLPPGVLSVLAPAPRPAGTWSSTPASTWSASPAGRRSGRRSCTAPPTGW